MPVIGPLRTSTVDTGPDIPVILMVAIRARLLTPMSSYTCHLQVTLLTSAVDGGKMSALWSR
jgi:hypothetical protein